MGGSEGEARAEGDGVPVVLDLPNDELGAAAEGLFIYLCPRALIVCNKSDRDRSGWDFVVDLPMQDGILDQRSKTTCHVQLKATKSVGTGNVQLRLSAADLLAKSPLPAVIIVFRMRPDGTPIRGYVVHLLGAPLEKLLRRLRHEQFIGNRDINRQSISFDYRKLGHPFEVTPQGLRAAIERACGPDPAAYSAEKLGQLAELGYGDDRIVGDVFFRPDSDEQLTRVVLGMVPLKPLAIQAFDNRFDMPVPYDHDMLNAVEEIMLSPPSAGGCEIVVTGAPLTPPATFHAEIFFAPPFDARLRMLIRHADFSFLFHEREADFETKGIFEQGGRTLDDLVMLLRAMANLASGEGAIVMSGDDGRFGPIKLPMSNVLTGPDVEDLPALYKIASDWRRLLELAGVRSKASLAIGDLWDSRWIQLAADLLLRAKPEARFAFDTDTIAGDGGALKAIYFNSAELAGDGISYGVEIELQPTTRDQRVYSSVSFRPIDVRPMVPDLYEYMEELASRYEHPIMIHPDHLREVGPERLEVAEAVGNGSDSGRETPLPSRQ
ncbi:hypothetical protein ATE68_09780 [Sphingopyxis sp. H038]|jgi:hypothetical protein|uniref:hypothetical protein n=1 Tax=unclassified Sphingopyxis TaxID=2614943 RepID=UPI0005101D96|nr:MULTISPECIES: hypothetical protein [unclassified Sphingopyxis]MBU0774201.1 hypothetical protein [Alphaproteobacteria bacterium]KGB53568.1 hypothetical protein FG95_03265 [Sphingopyxis sp. LC363]KTD99589.1 hypothetical protein ATE78_22535 [Sphingopyxis sp. H012]KTE05223.1 hypothetical protein ATE76_21460 [Sphingopyxis sp. H093]KTE09401.1 hypothetical protein ATE70_16385 [Sphingopyxis sp. H053]|eukprot:TRINITY_DN1989_c0_g1_i6.p1 TRINITY_DN1989_c0_g1~~TRINITY_DN1989_c0_g1_i6.p1  ORF type:complete len:550 (-),score=86.35 TRINITY_DN1989_c0_g1_i6:1141-2790(-)